MTFKELQDAALGTSFDPARYRTYAQRFLNRAQQRIARRIGMAATEALATVTTQPGVNTYDVPVDFAQLRGDEPIIDSEGRPLEQVDVGDMLTATNVSGEPRYFSYTGKQIRFYPTPAAAATFTMIYRAFAPRMVEDDAEPVIPEDYHELLVLYAKGRLYQEEDDQAAGSSLLGMFESELREMRAEQQRATAFRRQVPRMWRGSGAPTFRLP